MKNERKMRMRFFMALFCCAFAFGCVSKDDNVAISVKGASIKALTDSTRTSFDGEQSLWSVGDKLKVALGPVGGVLAVEEFTLQNATSNEFINEDLSLNSTMRYNAYALYSEPATESNIVDKSAEVDVGAAIQYQTGTSPSHIAHLDPLYGKVEGAQHDGLRMMMYHTAAVLKIDVKNITDEDIGGISSVQIVAPSGVCLSGSRKIDYTTSATSAVSGSNDSNTVTVEITSSGSIAKEATFTVWAAVAPFKISAGESLKFVITTLDNKVLEYTKLFDSQFTCAAGSILHTTIEPTPRVEQILLQWGYLDGYTQPQGMPECTTDMGSSSDSSVNEVGSLSGNYSTSYGAVVIDGKVKHAYVSQSKYIRFRDITSSHDVNIYFPVIANYRLYSVKVSIPKEKTSNIKFGIRPTLPSVNDKNQTQETTTFNLASSVASNQYGLYIYSTRSTKQSFDLTGIELTYVLE